jgi:hypothetical protein
MTRLLFVLSDASGCRQGSHHCRSDFKLKGTDEYVYSAHIVVFPLARSPVAQ